ncbi:MAG: hybrid sensor histidine kinase/response regulator [Deltaproteobacteria bacterium]|nr:hybrid sensor histidine kinase/response regulator [Deltaproteobacteria bacterium]
MTAHVLFVDDEEPNLVVFEAVCGDDFPVLTASSGAAGLQLMREHEIGVVLTDQRMPGMTGIELLEKVEGEYPDTIRLLITAYSDLQAAEDAINRGHVRRYMRKPWDPLRAELRDAIDLYNLNTRVKQLEQRLLETERAYSLSVVASGLADELRSPVGWIRNNLTVIETSISAATAALEEATPNVTRARGTLAQVENAVIDARDGVKRILELTEEMARAPEEVEAEVVDLADAVRVALRKAESSGLRGRALIEVATGVEPKVMATRTNIVQIALNLLANAIQRAASREGGQGIVRVTTAILGDKAVLDVSDNGPPIGADQMETVFKPFGVGGRLQGAGVGLAISKRIAEELGGELEVRATDAKETCFRLTLPPAKNGTGEA